MAVINFNLSGALKDKIIEVWGSTDAWEEEMKATTKRRITNRISGAQVSAARESQREARRAAKAAVDAL
jgi:hypothetical protein